MKKTPRLERLELENIRCFEHLVMDFVDPGTQGGQWVILLGDNGVGKTTVLRSLAWAASQNPGLRLSISQVGSTFNLVPFVRMGAESRGHIRATLDGDVRTIAISPTHAGAKLAPPPAQGAWPRRVYGYGTTRGSALGGPDRSVELGNPAEFVDTLFSSGARLIHAETWLRKLAFGALRNSGGPEQALYDAVIATLVRLLPGIDAMEVTEDRVIVRGPEVPDLDLANLSDGYLTTLGWTLDLIARWVEAERAEKRVPDGDIAQSIDALVLIDEIDLHLHPRWQRHIIDDLRAAFPNATFVVTTHSPLTVQSARPGETWVLTRIDGRIQVQQRDPAPGSDADDLLTGDLFGLPSTLDKDTLALLDQHRALLRDGAKQSDPKRKRLEKQIRLRIGSFAELPEERVEMESMALTDDEADLLKARMATLRRR